MKVLLAPAAAAALFVVLVSCQQAYEDKSARASGSSTPTATLTAPAANPNAVPAISSTSPLYLTFSDKDTLVPVTAANSLDAALAMGQLVANLAGDSLVVAGNSAPHGSWKVLGNAGAKAAATTTTTPTPAPTPAPTTGYQYLTYTSTSPSGNVLDPSESQAGTYMSSDLSFIEQSNDYAAYLAAPTGNATVFKKAEHGLLNSTEIDTIAVSGAPYSTTYFSSAAGINVPVILQGTRLLNRRNEWYMDAYVSPAGETDSTTGIYEAAVGFIIAAVWDTGTKAADNVTEQFTTGKFVVSVVGHQIYSGTGQVVLTINIDVYDSNNKLINSVPGAGSYTYTYTAPPT